MTQRNPRPKRVNLNFRTPRQKRLEEVRRYYDQRYAFWVRNGYLPEEADELARFNIHLSRDRKFIRRMVARRRTLIANLRRRGLRGSNTERGSDLFRALERYYDDYNIESQITQLYIEIFGTMRVA